MRENTKLVLSNVESFVGKTMLSTVKYDNPPLDSAIIKKLEDSINDIVDIPWIPEFIEGIGINKLLKLLDGFVGQKLKPEYHVHYITLITAYVNGGIEEFAAALSIILNIYIDIPLLDETDEQEIFDAIMEILIGFIPDKWKQ